MTRKISLVAVCRSRDSLRARCRSGYDAAGPPLSWEPVKDVPHSRQNLGVQRVVLLAPGAIALQLSSPDGAVLGTPSTTQIALIDNERPDLVVGSLAGPAQAATGSTMMVVAAVINQAGGAAPPTTLGIFISSSSNTPGAGTRIGLVAIPGLAGRASYTATTSVSVPVGLATGNYFLSAVADIVGVAIEESDTNNGLTAPAQVDVVFFQ